MMTRAGLVALFCGLGLAGLGSVWAQQPTAYTVNVVNSMFGPSVQETIYRKGSKAVIDLNTPAPAGGTATHVRSLYDLSAHTNQSWDLTDSSGGCSSGTFSGDWGDPFASTGDLSTAKVTGTETMNGFSTKVYEVEAPGMKAKAWVDAKTGMTVKMAMAQTGAELKTMLEVKKLTVGAPTAAVFVLPASCTAASGPPPVSQRDQGIATETGGKVGDFVDAVMTTAPGSQDSCSVAIRVMKAGSMAAIASGFKMSADTLDEQGNNVPGGKLTVTSGANGVLRISNAPPRFNMTMDFGDAGGGGGMIRRQCWGAVSTLLLVVKDPQNLGKGADWVWDKNGKYAVK